MAEKQPKLANRNRTSRAAGWVVAALVLVAGVWAWVARAERTAEAVSDRSPALASSPTPTEAPNSTLQQVAAPVLEQVASVARPAAVPAAPLLPASDADAAAGLRLPDRATADAAAFTSLDGKQTFRVPQPGDPEWQDYVAMLTHPHFRSALTNAAGRALPYDPEWRSEVRGRREVTPIEDEFQGGAPSAEALGRALVQALVTGDRDALHALVINEDEFRSILWPEFPQSRPYLKVPVGEAWGFQRVALAENAGTAIDALQGRTLDFEHAELKHPVDYTNFTMVRDVVLWARDGESGAMLGLRAVPVFVERHGRWKAYAFAKENRLAPIRTGR